MAGLRAGARASTCRCCSRRWSSTADDARARPRAPPADDFPVVVIGCGESGLLAGIRLKEAGIPFTIVEKNAGVGGTWWQNTYPGARVDVGNHFYCYSFEPTDQWTHFFAEQPELQAYFQTRDGQHDIGRHVLWETEVTEASLGRRHRHLDRARARPRRRDDELSARAVISAVGQLNRPHLPTIDGQRDFAGPAFHSARVGPLGRPARQAGRHDRRGRQRIPDRARHRATTSTASPCSSAPRSGCSRTRTTTPRSAPACSGRCGICRSTAGGTDSCCSGPAATRASRRPASTPDYPDQQTAVSEINEITRIMFTEWISSQVGDDRRAAGQGGARLPGDRQAHAAGQRQLVAAR